MPGPNGSITLNDVLGQVNDYSSVLEKTKQQQDYLKLQSMLQQQGKEQELQRTLGAYKDLSNENPNANITIDGVRVDTMGPAEKTSGEAKNIYGELDRQTSEDKKTLDTVHRLDEMLKNPNQLDPGMIQSELAREAVSGRIPLQEYNRVFPDSLKQTVGRVVNYVSPELGNKLFGKQALNDEQLRFANQANENMRNAAQDHIKKVRDELSRGASQIAPMMTRQGTAQPFVNNIGSAYLNQAQQPQPQQQTPPPTNYKSAPPGSGAQAAQQIGTPDPQAAARARLQELQRKAGMSN